MLAAWSIVSIAVLVLMVIFGLVFAVGAAALAWAQTRMRGRATGHVMHTAFGPEGETVPVVSFRTADGAQTEFVGGASVSRLFGPRVGDDVPVRYDERHPKQARIATFGGSYLALVGLFAFGAALLVAAAWGVHQERAEAAAEARQPRERIAVYSPLQRAVIKLCMPGSGCTSGERARRLRTYDRAKRVALRSRATVGTCGASPSRESARCATSDACPALSSRCLTRPCRGRPKCASRAAWRPRRT